MKINGKEKKALFLYYTETIAESHSKTLFQREDNNSRSTFLFPLADQDEVDAIYYAHFNARKIFDEGNDWETVLEHAELLWEK